MRIEDFIREELILPDLRARRKNDAIREIATHLADSEGLEAEDVRRVLIAREELGSTALEEGIAIPHAKLGSIAHLVGCVARSRKGIDFESEDGSPTYLFFVLIAPENSTGDHLKALARISRLLKDSSARKRLMAAETAAGMYEILAGEGTAASW